MATDWRAQIQTNNHRTMTVIGLFLLIYVLIGLLLDTLLYTNALIDGKYYSSFSLVLEDLLTLKLMPVATLIMLGVASISIFITYKLHNRIMMAGTQYKELTLKTAATPTEQALCNILEEMKVAAGMRYMPKLYLIDADYMNAFASGYSEESAMIAVTRGLAEKLNRAELQAVIAHELSHIRHGDIKLTLFAVVLSNIMLMVIDTLFHGLLYRRRDDNKGRNSNNLSILIVVLRILLPLVTMFLILYLSRSREYMADAGCVELQRDNQPLINALLKINKDYEANTTNYANQHQATKHESIRKESYIYNPTSVGIRNFMDINEWFSTHPTMSKRLAALGYQGEI